MKVMMCDPPSGWKYGFPKLKEAADEYHRQLDKYRNFDSLKETE